MFMVGRRVGGGEGRKGGEFKNSMYCLRQGAEPIFKRALKYGYDPEAYMKLTSM